MYTLNRFTYLGEVLREREALRDLVVRGEPPIDRAAAVAVALVRRHAREAVQRLPRERAPAHRVRRTERAERAVSRRRRAHPSCGLLLPRSADDLNRVGDHAAQPLLAARRALG